MDRVIQIANLVADKGFANPQRGRVYSAKGISPCIDNMGGGNREPKFLIICKRSPPKIRYVLGRTNAKGKGENHTLKFHVNSYFGCVTANIFTNRETWIAEIKGCSFTNHLTDISKDIPIK